MTVTIASSTSCVVDAAMIHLPAIAKLRLQVESQLRNPRTPHPAANPSSLLHRSIYCKFKCFTQVTDLSDEQALYARMKMYYDGDRSPPRFGDQVYLRIAPLNEPGYHVQGFTKLSTTRLGQFRVIRPVGPLVAACPISVAAVSSERSER
jgi:hypothetical protein